ncbi:hypothetical protein BDU57DRAFT_589003 [Ampelomyces quisqualis]|uniref:Uncharacterized protein n=1 Tax=Ampelomyces quisqualis TaxID=50730 RepID=A0A6A5QGF6_AMPQU|nr:hypothetical protein BDU57DRAFT_589003 [Ampelomyces quisqualis]
MARSSDIERSPASSPTPLLRRSRASQRPDSAEEGDWYLLKIVRFFGGGIYAPDPSTYDPIKILLNVEDSDEKDELTQRWKDNKLSELNFVGVVAALLAGVLTSTGSWPNILPNGAASPWSVRTSWYCGIVLSLFSILSAADQTVRLHRLSSHRDGLANIRRLLARKGKGTRASTSGVSFQPSLIQIMTWQMPVMFLTSATLCMIVGMFLHVWSATKDLAFFDLSDDNSKVAVTYTVVACVAIGIFFVGQVSLYSSIRN